MGKGQTNWKGCQPQERDGQNERKGKMEWKQGKGKSMTRAKARGLAKGMGVVVVMGVCMYVYNRLLCICMDIISVYMYIYTTRGENFLTLNHTHARMGKNQAKGCGGLHNFHAQGLTYANCPSCSVKGCYVNHVSSSCTSVKGKYLTPAQRLRKAPERAKNPWLCGYGAKEKSPTEGIQRL